MIIYKITNKITNKCYIGKTNGTIESRFKKHIQNAKKRINRRLYDSMNYHGYENFYIEQIASASTITELNEKEIRYIDEFNSMTPNGYNMTIGGDGGNTLLNWSDEDRKALYARQGEKRRGKRPAEFSIIMSEVSKLREKNKTEDQKAKIAKDISNTLKRKYESGEIAPTMPPIKYGKDHPGYVDIDADLVCAMIKNQWKLIDICIELGVKSSTINARLKEKFGKTFAQIRKDYGIRGAYGSTKRINFN